MPSVPQGAGDRSLLRRINTHAALLRFRERPHTVSELAEQLGLSRTAVEDVVRDLVDLGWIVQLDEPARDARPGRPAKSYRFAAESGHVIGVDIGVHKILCIVADLRGEPRSSRRAEVGENAPAQERLSLTDAVVRDCLRAARLDMDDVWCAGIGSPGVIGKHGTVDRYGGNGLPGWIGLDLAAEFKARWGMPVHVDSDNNLGTMAEHWRGSARGARDVVYVLSGNRTSAGILINGAIYRGHRGAAGLVGALPQLGWAQAPAHVEALAGSGIEPAREAMFSAAREGNPLALAALDGFAADLATGLVAMALAVDPELIVLGGGVSRGGDVILDAIRKHVERLHEHAPRLTLSSLGDESVALGAVKAALDSIEAGLLSAVETAPGFPPPSRTTFTKATT
ncbi:ROK family protein [Sinosporangium siamense]|uniref:Transcriptional regulator n=1 Tax=Sinosporangium siamense TaxID=1367973 RepID=A0A919RN20_9ACTN|nr:ROK family transcriptional regulator [Sinosporangium siamense]GII96802.1 transcriptional regulator [Sinosporangium siamense]